MMFVAKRTSPPPSAKSTMTPSTSSGGNSPCATRTVSSGVTSASRAANPSKSAMRGATTKLCPPRRFSRSKAVRSVAASKGARKVRIGLRRAGGLAMMLTSCTPTMAACSVRGMGVAVIAKT